MVLGPIKRETTHNKAASVASDQDMENFRKLCRNNIENAAGETDGLDRAPRMLTESPSGHGVWGKAGVREFLLPLLQLSIFCFLYEHTGSGR